MGAATVALKSGLQPLRNGFPADRRLPNVVRDNSKRLGTPARSHQLRTQSHAVKPRPAKRHDGESLSLP